MSRPEGTVARFGSGGVRWERSITMRLGKDADGLDRLLEDRDTREKIRAAVYPNAYWTPRLTRTDVVRWLVRTADVALRKTASPAKPQDGGSSPRKTGAAAAGARRAGKVPAKAKATKGGRR